MGKLAEAYVEIGSKTKGLDDGIAASEKSLAQFVSRANSLIGTIGVGLGTAGLVGFLKSAIQSGGDLNETISKTSVVFGDAAGQVMAFAGTMAEQFGAVRQTTLDAASMFGLITQGAGMSAEASAALSMELVRLADDASSFFNTSLDVALEKIRAGLVGESEPLRAFGVMLSETAVQQKALDMGLVETTKDLTEQEKVMARIKLITEGLAKAQGDHARTMDSYNQQIKKLSGEMENFKASIGSAMSAQVGLLLKEVQDKGVLAAIGKFTMDAAASPLQVNRGGGDAMQRAADAAAGVVHGAIKVEAQPGPMDVWAENVLQAFARAGRRKPEEFLQEFREQDGFGAFGPFGNIGLALGNAEAADMQRRRVREGWSGGWGQMGTMDFLRSAQESILRPKDETAKQQLDELKKIREILAKPQPPKKEGVILRGRA